jgi:hypothetical protein
MGDFNNESGNAEESSSSEPSLESLLAARAQSLREEKPLFELRADELKGIQKELQIPETGSLYYPACGRDNSPRLAFPGWDITYLDAVDTSVPRTSDRDTVIMGDLMNPPFNPEEIQFDIAMLISPGVHFASFTPEYLKDVVQFIKPNGLLICDNYHLTADDIRKYLGDTLEEVPLNNGNDKELKVFKKIADNTKPKGN